MLDNVEHLICIYLVLIFVFVVKLASLHDKVIHFQFTSSSFHYFLFHGPFCNKSVNYYVSFLPNSVGSINRLQIYLRIPVTIKDNHNIR
jgi:hypothetical protein